MKNIFLFFTILFTFFIIGIFSAPVHAGIACTGNPDCLRPGACSSYSCSDPDCRFVGCSCIGGTCVPGCVVDRPSATGYCSTFSNLGTNFVCQDCGNAYACPACPVQACDAAQPTCPAGYSGTITTIGTQIDFTGTSCDQSVCSNSIVCAPPPPSPSSAPLPPPPSPPAPSAGQTCGTSWYCDKPNTCNGGNNYQLATQCIDNGTGAVSYQTACDVNQCVIGGAPPPSSPPSSTPPSSMCLGSSTLCGGGTPWPCCPGLSCQHGQCKAGGGGGHACKMPNSLLLFPVAPDPTSAQVLTQTEFDYYGNIPSPPFNWRTDLNPGADCTWAKDGLYAEFYLDGHLIQHIDAPGYGAAGNNQLDWTFLPQSPAYIAARTGPNPIQTSYIPGLTSQAFITPHGYFGPVTPTQGVVHTWWIQYVAPNGNQGGTVLANNWNLGRFIIQGVNPPTPICQSDPRDPNIDLCDSTTNPTDPRSYASASRRTISVLDNGPASGIVYNHHFSLFDKTAGGTLVDQFDVPGSLNSINPALIPMSDFTGRANHTFSWYATSANPLLGITSAVSSPVWTFIYDDTSPTLVPSMVTQGCYKAGSPPPLIRFLASDAGSGIKSVTASITDNGAPSTVTLTCNPLQGCVNPNNGPYTANWPSLTSGHTYTVVSGTATDNAGNITIAPASGIQFLYSTTCTSPWLQTQQGDVHSNTSINTPGGP